MSAQYGGDGLAETLRGSIISGDTEGSRFLVDNNVRADKEALDAMLRFDLSGLPAGVLRIWDPDPRTWRVRKIGAD
ncbi:hypothetical protein GCM10020358_55930 [Amorphoplanes nipponensis]|uniref:Uncharacterized protein n=1 Tax=Actinoplanes nipponensis TaxID=135950 RepID=A0A919JJI0_9ACTN|nr:hypothetical protein Ani05nite_54470 [Actinoplanes nipponensis]